METYATLNFASVRHKIKWAFTTRRVLREDIAGLAPLTPNTLRAGDLMLCEVASLGQHKKIQQENQRVSVMYPGDLVVLCLGDRYAPDQFLGAAKLSGDMLDLLAGGGLAGTMEAAHHSMSKPTQLRPIGALADRHGNVVNIDRYAIGSANIPESMTVFGVFGASMNAGKTTAAVCLAHGLMRAGHNVAGIKATGTGAFGDFNAFEDAGIPASDFTDAGYASTFRVPLKDIEKGFDTLVGQAARSGATVAVVEIADGVFQEETREILQDSSIIRRMDGLLFAAPDALGAVGGTQLLSTYGLSTFAISGMVSLSTLGSQEAGQVTGLPVLTKEQLCTPKSVTELTAHLMRGARDATFSDEAVAA